MAKAPSRPAALAAVETKPTMTSIPAKAAASAPSRKKAPVATPAPEPELPLPVESKAVPEPEAQAEAPPVNAPVTMFDLYVDAAQAVDGTFLLPAAKESEQAFYKRLMQTLSSEKEVEGKLPIWDSLESTELGDIQPWYDNGVDALEKGQPVAALEGFDSYKQKLAETPTPLKAARNAGLAAYREKVAAEKAAGTYVGAQKKEKAPKAPKAPKGDGAVAVVQRTVIAHPLFTREQIKEQLVKDGHNINDGTLMVQYGNTRAILRAAIAAGATKADFKIE